MEWSADMQGMWLTLAIVNAGLAETKNRSRWYWFLWSLLLGPFATFLIVTWPRRESLTARAIAKPVESRHDRAS